jgi:peptidoglycan/xylan/chitin deacetylase (PgdA/CDA1 family)
LFIALKKTIRSIFFTFIRISGIPFLLREIVQRKRISIVLFHDIQPDSAENIFFYIKKKYNVISLNSYINAVKNKNSSDIPPKSLILTFDDGHSGNYKLLPLIKSSGIPVTIFLCAGIISTNKSFWFKLNMPGKIKEELKLLPNDERLKIVSEMELNDEEEDKDNQKALNEFQIIEMKQHVDFQSHTVTHPVLTKCSDTDATYEIKESKRILEEQFNLNINAFSYPNGNYSDREVDILKKNGYECGLTTDCGYNDIKSDLFRLKRFSGGDHSNKNEAIVRLSGLWSFIQKFKKSLSLKMHF